MNCKFLFVASFVLYLIDTLLWFMRNKLNFTFCLLFIDDVTLKKKTVIGTKNCRDFHQVLFNYLPPSLMFSFQPKLT